MPVRFNAGRAATMSAGHTADVPAEYRRTLGGLAHKLTNFQKFRVFAGSELEMKKASGLEDNDLSYRI